MTEVSKEAVDALAKAVWPLTTVNGEVTEMSRVASLTVADRLSKLGYTITPLAPSPSETKKVPLSPVVDEKLRDAVDLVKYYHRGNGVDADELTDAMQTIYSAIAELEELRAAQSSGATTPMTEEELEGHAIDLKRDIDDGLNGWAGIVNLAKKYRG